MKVGWRHNNIKIPTLQELLGMKIYTICLRSEFRDYYDIYCLLKSGAGLDEAISYASYLTRHTIRSTCCPPNSIGKTTISSGCPHFTTSPRSKSGIL